MSRRLLIASRGGSFAGPLPGPFTASGPYDPALVTDTYLTQLHCHTTGSDGSSSPATVAGYYVAAGYQALAITDHDVVTTQTGSIANKITASELTAGGNTTHIIGTDSTYTRGSTTNVQTIIDGIRGVGGQAHVAHPKWLQGASLSLLQALTGYIGIEIHNAKCIGGTTSNPVTYPGFAMDRWDDVLTNHRRDVWGFAVDDLHNLNAYLTYDVGRVQVFSESNDVAGIMAALVAGNFAADVSNYGVTPGYPVRSSDGVELACTGATRIEAWGPSGLLQTATGASISHEWTGESYVRLVAVGDYTEPFAGALSDRWSAFSGTWAVAGGVLALASDATGHNIHLRRHREGDFTAQIDIKLDDNRATETASLLFNVLNNDYWYALRIGTSASTASLNNALGILKTTNGGTSITVIGTPAAYTATEDVFHTVKLDYTAATGRIRAKVWATGGSEPGWMVDATDTGWKRGGFGLRANYTAAFDNLAVDGFRTYYQPVSVD